MESYKETQYLPNGYLINNKGIVTNHKGKILKQSISNSGYYFINIKNKGYFLHRALAFAFIDVVDGFNYVNHKDGNKLNNDIANLEWCTKSQNAIHAYKNGFKKQSVGSLYKGKFGNQHNRSKSVLCIESGIIYGSQCEASRLLNISNSSVSWSIKYKKPIYGMHFEVKE